MRELREADRARILPLVPDSHTAGHMTFVHAVTEGSMAGVVFVDDPVTPAAAVVGTYSGFCFALGRPGPSFAHEALDGLATMRAAEPPALWATSDAWSVELQPLFAGYRERDEFLPPDHLPEPPPLPGGIELSDDLERIAKAYRAALAREPGAGPGEPWLLDTWGGAGRFVARSFGLGLFAGAELVGICAACAIAANAVPVAAEIEIWTSAPHRRARLATIMGAAFIRQCHLRGMVPAWTCEGDNFPSRRLAERLGFRWLRRIRGFPLEQRLAAAG